MQEFSMVGGYTENLEKPQNCQNWGVGTCSGMGACSGQYGNTLLSKQFSQPGRCSDEEELQLCSLVSLHMQ